MIRPIDNDYISKNRYYELKYFCYQYREWEKEKSKLKICPVGKFEKNVLDPTGELATKIADLDRKMEVVDEVLIEVAPDIDVWLKKCIVDGKSYEKQVADGVPCCKEYFYKKYKLFFSRLNNCL